MSQRFNSLSVWTQYIKYEPLIIISLLWFVVQFLRFAFPPLFETFQAEFGVSNAETGFLFTSLMLAYATMQFPAGAMSDQIGRSRIISFGAILFSLTSIAIFAVSNFVILLMLASLIGATTAGHKTVSINLISNRYPDRTGYCLGVFDTIGQFGGVIAPIVAVILLSSIGWQWTFVFSGLVGIGLAGINWRRIDTAGSLLDLSTKGVVTLANFNNRQYIAIFSNKRLFIFTIISISFTFEWNGVSAFLPLYLANESRLTTQLSSLLYSGFFIVSLSQLLTGRVSDSANQLWIGLFLFGVMVLTTLTLLFTTRIIFVISLVLIMGAAFHGFRPVRDSYLMTIIPNMIGGGALGIVRTVMVLIGAVAPAIMGIIADIAGFRLAFGLICGVLTLGGFMTGLLIILEYL